MITDSRIIYTPRSEPKKLKRPFRKSLLSLATACLLLFLIVAAVYLARLPYWQIKHIEVSGQEALSEEEIRAKIIYFLRGEHVIFIPRSSAFLINTRALATALREVIPRIESVSISRVFPDVLKVTISERKLFGIFCGEKDCGYIDHTGFVYEGAASSTGSLIIKIKSDSPEVVIGSRAIEGDTLASMKFLKEEIRRVLNLEVTGYELSSKISREIRVITSAGFKIYFNRDDDFKNVFRVLKTVLDEEIKEKRSDLEYIDARFGNKVFYKLR